jgi:hypothetical protein
MVKDWLHIHDFDPSSWSGFDSVEHWLISMAFFHGGRRKTVASLLMLGFQEIWNGRNARSLKNVNTMPTIVDIIKSEAKTSMTGTKHLGLTVKKHLGLSIAGVGFSLNAVVRLKLGCLSSSP